MSGTNNQSNVNIIVPVVCVLALAAVALVAFRKPILRKVKLILRSRSRADDDDLDDVSYSIAPGGVTYSLRSLGGYTAETVLSGYSLFLLFCPSRAQFMLSYTCSTALSYFLWLFFQADRVTNEVLIAKAAVCSIIFLNYFYDIITALTGTV